MMTKKKLALVAESTPLETVITPVWQRAFVDWLTNLNSSRTRRAYHAAWLDFLRFRLLSLAAVTQSDVLAYRHHLETTESPHTHQPYSATTINQRLSALSSFYRFAHVRGLCDENPCAGIKRKPVSPYGKATWLDGEQQQDLRLLQAVDTSTLQGKRDFALLLLFLTTALRVESVARLHIGALRMQGEQAFLMATNKGGGEVEVPLVPLTTAAILDYLDTREDRSPGAPLFVATERGRLAMTNLSHTGQTARDGQQTLTARAIRKLVKKYADKAFGPGHGISPHSLRHTAAMNAILEGASVTEVSRLLQHKSLGITTVYLHATDAAGTRAAQKLGKRYQRLLQEPE